jgi:hypothetical protein
MKKILYSRIYFLQVFITVISILVLVACEKDDVNPPMITEIRNYAASPDDTLITNLNTGQWVVVLGQNLSGVTQVYFGSTPANINRTLLTEGSIVVQVPDIPFAEVPRDQVNIVTVVSNGGTTSFEIPIIGQPLISYVRDYVDAPGDSIIHTILPGQLINIVGYNLKDATSIAFQGVEADLNNVIYTDTSAIVRVPGDLSGSDEELVDMFSVTNEVGTGSFAIKILGPPIILAISNENPNEGDVVVLFGNNFVSVESITFAGVEISSFEISPDGMLAGFVVPELTESGPVEITTPAGTFTTLYNVNDVTTGVLANFDAISPVGWGGGGAVVSDNATDFPGNKGKYALLQNDALNPWDWGAWNSKRIVILDPVTWLPAANVSDPLNSWAVKFEINVPSDWNGTTLFISSEHNDFKAFYQPWKKANGDTFSYRTNGWQTVTVPFSQFFKGWGGNVPPATIAELLGGTTGVSAIAFQTMNISSTTTPKGLNSAVDNIRVVKIK